MNTRVWLLAGGCFAALVLIGVGHEYLNTGQETTGTPGRVLVRDQKKLEEPIVSPSPSPLQKGEGSPLLKSDLGSDPEFLATC